MNRKALNVLSSLNRNYRVGLLVSPTMGPVLPLLFEDYPGYPGCYEMHSIGLYGDKEHKLNNDLRMHLSHYTFQSQDALPEAENVLVIYQFGHQVRLKGLVFAIKPFSPFEVPVHVTLKGNQKTENLRVTDADKVILLDEVQPYLRGKGNVEVGLVLPKSFQTHNGKGLGEMSQVLAKFSAEVACAQKELEEQVAASGFLDVNEIETSIRIEGQNIFFRAKGITTSAETSEVRRLIFAAVKHNLEKDARKQNLEDQLAYLDKQRQQLLQELQG